MKLIVIGASGFIGSAIYNLAKIRKISVIGTTTKRTSAEFSFFDITKDNIEKILIEKAFFSDDEPICAVIAAGITNINQCYTKPSEALATNVTGTKRLLTYFYSKGIKTLFFSSDAVFDGQAGNYCESDLPIPKCNYGKQKLAIECFIRENTPEFLIYRLSKVVGDTLAYNHLFSELYRKYQNNEPIKCIEGISFCPTYVNDIAKCTLLGLQGDLHGLYHVANPERFVRTLLSKKFIDKLGERYVESVPVEFFGFGEPKALDTTMDINKFINKTSFRFTSMDSVIDNFIKNIEYDKRGCFI